MNTVFFTDGLFLQVPQNVKIPKPIHAVYLSVNDGRKTQSHPRNLILLGEDSQVTLIEHFWGDNVGPYLTNALTEVCLSRGAVLEHVKIQDESREAYHIGTLAVKQEEASRLVSRNFLQGSGFSHQETESLLGGMKGECVYEGLYLLKDEQHMDILTYIDHLSPSCKSEEIFKGVLDGKATGVFGGRILVRENAQKTDARQVNKDLQLSNAIGPLASQLAAIRTKTAARFYAILTPDQKDKFSAIMDKRLSGGFRPAGFTRRGPESRRQPTQQ